MSSSISEKPLVLRCCFWGFVGTIGLSCFIALSLESVWIDISCPYRHSNRRPLVQISCQEKLALEGRSQKKALSSCFQAKCTSGFSFGGNSLQLPPCQGSDNPCHLGGTHFVLFVSAAFIGLCGISAPTERASPPSPDFDPKACHYPDLCRLDSTQSGTRRCMDPA